MRELLIINNITFPLPEGSFDVTYRDKVNEYESESGKVMVEIIRKNIATIKVSYNSLPEAVIQSLVNVIHTTNTVTFYKKGKQVTIRMKATEISTPKKYYRYGVSVWGLSFSLEEM